MWNLKQDPNELIFERETDAKISKPNRWLQKGEWMDWEVGNGIYTLLCTKSIILYRFCNKDLVHSTGNLLYTSTPSNDS